MKHSPLRKVAVLELFLAQVKILTYKSGLERGRGRREWTLKKTISISLHFPPEAGSYPSLLSQPFFPPAFTLLLAPSPFTYIAFKLLSHQWSFRSIHPFLLLL